MERAFNPRTGDEEASGFLPVQGQPGLHIEYPGQPEFYSESEF